MTTSAYARSAKFLRETSRKKKKSSRKAVAAPTASFSVDASSRPSTTTSSYHGTQSRDNRVHNEDHRSHSQGPFSQQRTASNEHSRALLPLPPRFGTHSASTQHSQDTRSSSASSYPPSLQGYSVVTDQEFPLSQLSMSQFSSQSCGDGTSHSSSSHHHSQLRQQSQKSHTTSSRSSSHKAVSSSSLFGSGQGGSLVAPPPPFGLVHPTPRRSDPSLQALGGAVDAPPPVVGGGMPPPKRKVRPWLNAGSTTIETAMERTKLFAAAAAASVRTHKRSKRMEPPEPRLQEEDHKSQPYNNKTAPSNDSVAPRDPQQDMVPEQATVPQASRITHHFKPIDKTTTKDSSDKVDDSQDDDDVLSAREQSLAERERSLEETRAEIEKVLQAKLAQIQEAGTDQLARIAQAGDDALQQETKRAGETMARLEAASSSQLAKMGQARDDAVAAVKEACVREMTTLHQAGGAFMRKLKNFKEGVFQECANLPLKLLGTTAPSSSKTTNLLESPSSMASTDLSQDDCPTTPASKRTRRRREAVHQAHGLSSSEVNDDDAGTKQPRPRKRTATKGARSTADASVEPPKPKRKGAARTRSSSKTTTTDPPAVPNAPPRMGRRRKQVTRSPVPTAKKETSCVTPCTKISTQMEEDSPLSVIVEQSSQMESKRRRQKKRKHYGSSQESSSSSSSLDLFHEPTGDKENGISAFRGKTANKKRAKTKPGCFSFDDDFSFLSA